MRQLLLHPPGPGHLHQRRGECEDGGCAPDRNTYPIRHLAESYLRRACRTTCQSSRFGPLLLQAAKPSNADAMAVAGCPCVIEIPAAVARNHFWSSAMRLTFKAKKLIKHTFILTLVLIAGTMVFWRVSGDVWATFNFQILDLFYRQAVKSGYGPKLSPQIVYLNITDQPYDYFGKMSWTGLIWQR